MDMSPQEYQAYIKQKSPKSPIWKDTALAFLIGGAICVLGQLILDGYRSLGLDKTDAGTATSVTLIFLAALTTGLNLYNSLVRFAGAGTLVPITGFANSVVSPAIDFKAEDAGTADLYYSPAGYIKQDYLGVWRMEDDCLYLKLSADSGDEIDASFPILISPSGEDLYFQRSRTGAGIPFLPDGTDSVGLLLYTG